MLERIKKSFFTKLLVFLSALSIGFLLTDIYYQGNKLGGNLNQSSLFITQGYELEGCFIVFRDGPSTKTLTLFAIVFFILSFLYLYRYLPKLPNEVREVESRHETFNVPRETLN